MPAVVRIAWKCGSVHTSGAPEHAYSEVSFRWLLQCSLPSFFELECLSGPGWSVQQVSRIFCHFLPSTGIMRVPTCSYLYMEAGNPKPGPHAWDISLAQCFSFLLFPESHSGLAWPGLELKDPCLCLSDPDKGVHHHAQPKASLFNCFSLYEINYKSIYLLEFKYVK